MFFRFSFDSAYFIISRCISFLDDFALSVCFTKIFHLSFFDLIFIDFLALKICLYHFPLLLNFTDLYFILKLIATPFADF